MQTISGTGEAEIASVVIFNNEGEPVEVVGVGENVTFKITVRVNADIPQLVLGYLIKDRLGQPIFGTTSSDHKVNLVNLKQGDRVNFVIRFPMNIGVGTYSLSTALALGKTHLEGNLEWRDLARTFNVVNISKITFIGVSWIEPEIVANRESRGK